MSWGHRTAVGGGMQCYRYADLTGSDPRAGISAGDPRSCSAETIVSKP